MLCKEQPSGEVETGEPRRCSEFGRHLVTFDCLPYFFSADTCLTYFLKTQPMVVCAFKRNTAHLNQLNSHRTQTFPKHTRSPTHKINPVRHMLANTGNLCRQGILYLQFSIFRIKNIKHRRQKEDKNLNRNRTQTKLET